MIDSKVTYKKKCVNTGSYYDTWLEIVEVTSLNGKSSFILTTKIGLHISIRYVHVCIDSSIDDVTQQHASNLWFPPHMVSIITSLSIFYIQQTHIGLFNKSGYTIYILNLDIGSRKYWNICDLFVMCWLRTYTVHRGQGEFW